MNDQREPIVRLEEFPQNGEPVVTNYGRGVCLFSKAAENGVVTFVQMPAGNIRVVNGYDVYLDSAGE